MIFNSHLANQGNDTALLLFSRTSEGESLAKNFLPFGSPGKNKLLTRKVIDRSIVLAKNSDLPFFVWDEKMQFETNFGERLANAVESVFSKGFKKIIVIGNDCLTLRHKHIREAALALQNNDSVLAPTKKGGAYLIGLTQKSFNKNRFTLIRWQTSFAYSDLQKLFGIDVFQMPVLNDVNNFIDLQKEILCLSKIDCFRIYAISIISSAIKYLIQLHYYKYPFIVRFLFGLKAPPFSFLPL